MSLKTATLSVVAMTIVTSRPATTATRSAALGRSERPQRHKSVPRSLTRLESEAEDIGDAVARGDWGKAASLAARARADVDALARESAPSTIASARQHLEQARNAIAFRRSLDAQMAANALSGEVVDLFSGYRPIVPVEVMRLDVLLRQAQLEGIAGSPQDAAPVLRQAQAIWSNLRAHPPLAGTETARQFDQELAMVERAASSANVPALNQTASAALEGVDALEHAFEKEHRPSR